ncbi:MAG: hypothetical protein ACTHNY_02100 [Solirubrobacterales bacterium]
MQDESLVAVEAAEPASGEVDLVKTLTGTYGFARSVELGAQTDLASESCEEAEAREKPFVRLPPPFVLLWLRLLEHEAGWSWPISDPATDEDAIVFLSYPSEVLAATGGCVTDRECTLSVEGEVWQGEGSGFVALADLEPYMPPHAG